MMLMRQVQYYFFQILALKFWGFVTCQESALCHCNECHSTLKLIEQYRLNSYFFRFCEKCLRYSDVKNQHCDACNACTTMVNCLFHLCMILLNSPPKWHMLALITHCWVVTLDLKLKDQRTHSKSLFATKCGLFPHVLLGPI